MFYKPKISEDEFYLESNRYACLKPFGENRQKWKNRGISLNTVIVSLF